VRRSVDAPPVRRARGREEHDAALALRRTVFCEEQGVAEELEVDGRDDEAVHLVALDGDRVVGTCRLLLDGAAARFGRLAVARAHRGRGTGGALLAAAEDHARTAGAKRMALAAQVGARGLYARQGFGECGEPFEEAGIEHVTMEKRLA